MYKIPAKPYRTEETIKRSRFIATLAHAATSEDAKVYISKIKDEYPDATHHCWAYVAGPPGDTARIGMNDDGEPHGTAGKPILTVLLHSGIGEIVAVVTRYFGGTKLGTGGLVRAYSGSVKRALADLSIKEKIDVVTLTATLDYPKSAVVKQIMESFHAEIIEENYAAEVSFTFELPGREKDKFIRAINQLTGGEIVINSGSDLDNKLE